MRDLLALLRLLAAGLASATFVLIRLSISLRLGLNKPVPSNVLRPHVIVTIVMGEMSWAADSVLNSVRLLKTLIASSFLALFALHVCYKRLRSVTL